MGDVPFRVEAKLAADSARVVDFRPDLCQSGHLLCQSRCAPFVPTQVSHCHIVRPGVWEVDAGSHFEAMTLYHEHMNWGPYTTEHEWDDRPYPDDWRRSQEGDG